jgi:hypothetical protein
MELMLPKDHRRDFIRRRLETLSQTHHLDQDKSQEQQFMRWEARQ